MWTISLPLKIVVSKSTTFYLNLNEYRNANFHILNKAKVNFGGLIRPLLKDLPAMEACSLGYTLFPATKRKCDVSNICSIVDKFFSDTLVDAGKIPDDNYEIVLGVQYLFGAVDPKDPRVEVTIRPFTNSST